MDWWSTSEALHFHSFHFVIIIINNSTYYISWSTVTVIWQHQSEAVLSDIIKLLYLCIPVHTVTAHSLLRSADHCDLVVPHVLSRFGCRSFCVSGPTIWNDLPVDIRSTDIMREQFKCSLKIWLFECAYGRRRVWETVQSEGAPKKWTYLLTCADVPKISVPVYFIWRCSLVGVAADTLTVTLTSIRQATNVLTVAYSFRPLHPPNRTVNPKLDWENCHILKLPLYRPKWTKCISVIMCINSWLEHTWLSSHCFSWMMRCW